MPSTTPPTGDPARPAVEQAYTAYWDVLPQAEQAPTSRRRALLAPYTADPQLGSVLNGIDDLHRRGRTSWGSVEVHVRSVQVEGNRAVLRDCQDGSNAGEADRQTGDRLTRGRTEGPLEATLVRGDDQRWRVVNVTALPGGC